MREPGERGLQDLPGHPGERVIALVAVAEPAQVDLTQRVQTRELEQIDEQTGLDAVAGDERHLLEELAAAGALTGQRLHEAGQLWPERVEQRTGHQLGHPSSAGQRDPLAGGQRPVVRRLDESDCWVGQQRAEQPGHERAGERLEVGVDEDQQVTGGDVQRLPQHLALARDVTCLGQYVPSLDNGGAGLLRHLHGPVGRPRVDDHELVHEGNVPDQVTVDGPDDRTDRRFLVQRRQHDAHSSPSLGRQQIAGHELLGGVVAPG